MSSCLKARLSGESRNPVLLTGPYEQLLEGSRRITGKARLRSTRLPGQTNENVTHTQNDRGVPCRRHRPAFTITPSGCGAVGSARRSGRRGRWFKSSHPDHLRFAGKPEPRFAPNWSPPTPQSRKRQIYSGSAESTAPRITRMSRVPLMSLTLNTQFSEGTRSLVDRNL